MKGKTDFLTTLQRKDALNLQSCCALGVALSDAVMPTYEPQAADACAVYQCPGCASMPVNGQVLTGPDQCLTEQGEHNQGSRLSGARAPSEVDQLTQRDSDRPGCFGDCEEPGFSLAFLMTCNLKA